MSPSSEETPGHTGQELRVSLEFLSLTVLRFVVAHRRPPDYATCTYSPHIHCERSELLICKVDQFGLGCIKNCAR